MQNKSRLTIWVCEFISAGGLSAEALPDSLLQEGLLMRDALLADLFALGVDCITTHDERVPPPMHARSQVVRLEDDALALWKQQLATAHIDACWVIAPETDGVLLTMHQLVTDAGKPWVGCTAAAISLATAKSAMAKVCQHAGIRVLPHMFLHELMSLQTAPSDEVANAQSWVAKPDDGAGCESIFHFNSISDVIDYKNKVLSETPSFLPRLLLQPYVAGTALSMSVISTPLAVKVIAGHAQHIDIKAGCVQFNGAEVNAAAAHLPAMQSLAEQIHAAIPGLLGYWGADLILTPEQTLVLVEINPRLTTPYMALSSLLSENPAHMILEAALNHTLTEIAATGTISLLLSSSIVPASAAQAGQPA